MFEALEVYRALMYNFITSNEQSPKEIGASLALLDYFWWKENTHVFQLPCGQLTRFPF